MTFAVPLPPISPEAPCGADLSFSPEFDMILEKRREDDATLDQGAWVRPLKVADWPGVIAQCEALLRGRTQDLRLVAWWTDASTRVRGLAGLADGLEFCARLCLDRWNHLHPLPEDGDADPRAGSLAWLLAQVEAHARRLPPAATADEPRRCLDALERLQGCVDIRLGDDGPSFAPARQALEALLGDAERRTCGTGFHTEATASAQSQTHAGTVPSTFAIGTSPAAATAGEAPAGAPRDRAEALLQLRGVADFFRRTEPHSPVAYLADKAAHWADLPLHAWLRAVLRDPQALAHVEELLGVAAPGA